LIIWFGLIIIFTWFKKDKEIPSNLNRLYHINIYFYPLIASIIKYAIEANLIPYSWFWLNRLEHGFWSFCVIILLLPLTAEILKQSKFQFFILNLGLIAILGNLIEILEYLIRVLVNLNDYYVLSVIYRDTVLDMITNFIGGLLGISCVLYLSKKISLNKNFDLTTIEQ
jgi:hypothetical protein